MPFTLSDQERKRKQEQEARLYGGNITLPVQKTVTAPPVQATKPLSSAQVVADIYNVYASDKTTGSKLMQDFRSLQRDKSSQYYSPYTAPTNTMALQELSNLGVDMSKGVDDSFMQNYAWLKNYQRTGINGTPLAPTKSSSKEEAASYYYSKVLEAEDTTRKAEAEWAALQKDVSYWAWRKDRNYSDDEILAKVDMSKYPTLARMEEEKAKGTPVQLNRGVGFSQDALKGTIWATRSGGSSGDPFKDAVSYSLGRGARYSDDPKIRSKRDPNSATFNPYLLGSTLDEEAAFFGVDAFNTGWLEQNSGTIMSGTDDKAKQMLQRVYQAEQRTQKLETQLDEFNKSGITVADLAESAVRGGMTADQMLSEFLTDDFNELGTAAESLQRKNTLGTTRALPFDYHGLRDSLDKAIKARTLSTTAPAAAADQRKADIMSKDGDTTQPELVPPSPVKHDDTYIDYGGEIRSRSEDERLMAPQPDPTTKMPWYAEFFKNTATFLMNLGGHQDAQPEPEEPGQISLLPGFKGFSASTGSLLTMSDTGNRIPGYVDARDVAYGPKGGTQPTASGWDYDAAKQQDINRVEQEDALAEAYQIKPGQKSPLMVFTDLAKENGWKTIGDVVASTAESAGKKGMFDKTFTFINTQISDADKEMFLMLSDDEIAQYKKLYYNQGEQAAEAYFDSLKNAEGGFAERYRTTMEGRAETFGKEQPVIASVYSGLYSGQSAVEGAQIYFDKLLFGKDLSPNDERLAWTSFNKALLGSVSENMSDAGKFFYNSGMSIVQNVINRAAMGPASLVTMGFSASANTMQAVLDRGGSSNQAFILGTVSLLAETITEKAQFERFTSLMKSVKGGSIKAVLTNFFLGGLKSAIPEAGEELVSNMANMAADIVVMGKNSDVWLQHDMSAQGYRQDGMDPAEADAMAWEDVARAGGNELLMSAAGGAFSGFMFGEFATAMSAYHGRANQKAAAQTAQQLTNSQLSPETREGLAVQLAAQGMGANGDTKGFEQQVSGALGIDPKSVQQMGQLALGKKGQDAGLFGVLRALNDSKTKPARVFAAYLKAGGDAAALAKLTMLSNTLNPKAQNAAVDQQVTDALMQDTVSASGSDIDLSYSLKRWGQKGLLYINSLMKSGINGALQLSAQLQTLPSYSQAVVVAESNMQKLNISQADVNAQLAAFAMDQMQADVMDNAASRAEGQAIETKVQETLTAEDFSVEQKAIDTAAEQQAQAVQAAQAAAQAEAAAADAVAQADEQASANPADPKVTSAAEKAVDELEKVREESRKAQEEADKAEQDRLKAEQEKADKEAAARAAAEAQAKAELEQERQAERQKAEAARQQAEAERQTETDKTPPETQPIPTTEPDVAAEADAYVRAKFADASPEDQEEARARFTAKMNERLGKTVDSSFVFGQKSQRFKERVEAKFGVKLVSDPGMKPNEEAYYDPADNTIHLSERASRSTALYGIIMHELTHTAQTSQWYDQYRDIVLKMRYGENYTASDALKKDIETKLSRYQAAGHDLRDSNAAIQEIVAQETRKAIFADEASINRLVDMDVTLGRRILETLNRIIAGIKDSFTGESTADLYKARDLLEKALSDNYAREEKVTDPAKMTAIGLATEEETPYDREPVVAGKTKKPKGAALQKTQTSVAKALLKSVDPSRAVLTKAYILEDGRQMILDGYRAIIFNRPLDLPTNEPLGESYNLFKSVNERMVIPALRGEEITMPSEQVLKDLIAANKAALAEARANKETITDADKAPAWVFAGQGYAVRADWLLDMMRAFPDAKSYGDPEDHTKPIGFKGADGEGVILPIRLGRDAEETAEAEQRYLAKNKSLLARLYNKQYITGTNDAGNPDAAARDADYMLSREGPQYSLSDQDDADSDGRVLSQEQADYFKDSKVRDEAGKLKPMYHGTQSYGFTEFQLEKTQFGLFGGGFYFTDSKDIAKSYRKKGEGGLFAPRGVYNTYLNIRNPLDMDAPAQESDWRSFADKNGVEYEPGLTNTEMYKKFLLVAHNKGWGTKALKANFIKMFRQMGHDGLTHIGGLRSGHGETLHQVYIAFDSEQIKNISNKTPTSSPDIRYSLSDQDDADMDAYLDGLFPQAAQVPAGGENIRSMMQRGIAMPVTTPAAPINSGEVRSGQQIFTELGEKLGVPITAGKKFFLRSQKAKGAVGYHRTTQDTVFALDGQAIAVVSHEIGHHFDKKFGLSSGPEVAALMAKIQATNPGWISQYKAADRPFEAIAEFTKIYLMNRAQAVTFAGADYVTAFEAKLKDGGWLDAMREAQKQIAANLNATALDNFRAMVSLDNRRKRKNVKEGAGTLATKYADYTFPLVQLSQITQQQKGDQYSADKDSRVMALAYNATTDNFFKRMFDDALVDSKGEIIMDKSLRDIFRNVSLNDEKDFNTLWLLYHSLDRAKVNKAVISPEYSAGAIRSAIDELEQLHPDFKAAMDEAIQWYDTFMQAWMVNTGILAPGAYQRMKQMYPHYIPTRRVMDNDTGSARRDKGVSDISDGIMRATGSTRDIKNPVMNLLQNVQYFIGKEKMLEIGRAFANQMDTLEDVGFIAERVQHDIKATPTTPAMEQVQKLLDQLRNDPLMMALTPGVNEDSIDAVMDYLLDNMPEQIFTTSDRTTGQNVLNILREDGGYSSYLVHNQDILEALMHLPTKRMPSVLGNLSKVTRLISSTATALDPSFALPNVIADLHTAVVTGSFAASPVDGLAKWLGALGSYTSNQLKYGLNAAFGKGFKVSDEFRDYLTFGKLGSRYSFMDDTAQTTLRRKLYKGTNTKGILSAPFQVLETVNEVLENVTRFAEYKYGKADTSTYAGKLQGGKASREATVDFSKRGTSDSLKTLRAVVPFLGATIEGTYKSARTFSSENEGRRGAIAGKMTEMLLAGILLSVAKNLSWPEEDKKNYDLTDDDYKTKYTLWPKGDGTFFRIKRSQDPMVQWFMALGETVGNVVTGNEKDDPLADMVTFSKDIILNMAPTTTVASPLLDVAQNRTWYDGLIENYSMQERAVVDRYDENTPKAYKAASQVFNGLGVEWSPLDVEYLVKQYFGAFGNIGTQLLSSAAEGKLDGKTAVEILTSRFASRASVDPSYANNASKSFYAGRTELEQIQRTAKDGDPISFFRSTLTDEETERALREGKALLSGPIKDAQDTISTLWEDYYAIMDQDDYQGKETDLYNTRMSIVGTALQANQELASYREKYYYPDQLQAVWGNLFGAKAEPEDYNTTRLMGDMYYQDYKDNKPYMTTAVALRERYSNQANPDYFISFAPSYSWEGITKEALTEEQIAKIDGVYRDEVENGFLLRGTTLNDPALDYDEAHEMVEKIKSKAAAKAKKMAELYAKKP